MRIEDQTPDVICVGMSCADIMIPGIDLTKGMSDEMKYVNRIGMYVGGDATNQSIILSKLGLKTKLVTGIGKDNIGEFIENTVKSFDVDTSAFSYSIDKPSLATVIGISEKGERHFVLVDFYSSACMFEPDISCFKGAKVVSIGSLLAAPFLDVAITKKVLKAAKSEGALVCADVVFDERDKIKLTDFEECLSYIDYILPNDDEAEKITGRHDLSEMADVFLSFGIKNVVIKAGKKGCLFKNKNEEFMVPAYEANAIDTTGAGDNFASGFITALLEGKNHEECCLFAHGVAAIAVESVGANSGVRNRNQVDRFIIEHSN